MKSFAYRLCLRMIQTGRTEGLEEKIETFYATGRLKKEEYEDLIAKVAPAIKI